MFGSGKQQKARKMSGFGGKKYIIRFYRAVRTGI